MSIPFSISFNVNEEFNDYEKCAILAMITEYYNLSEGFRERMDILYNHVNIVKPTHKNEDDNKPHFNIALFNNFKYGNRCATKISNTIHVYTDFTKILCMTEHIKF